jgi:acetyltransferase-like isoleucine patch superfamily enzyme
VTMLSPKVFDKKLRLFWMLLWYLSRSIRQSCNIVYMRTVASCSYLYIGQNVVFDGIPDIVVPYSNVRIGSYSRIGKNCTIYTTKTGLIEISEFVTINNNCTITSTYSIQIGSNCLIAENVGIRDHNHSFFDVSSTIRSQGFHGASIVIGNDVWIGRNATILAGVTIGNGSIIGANSVVTKNIPSFSIAVGSPAKVIKKRV